MNTMPTIMVTMAYLVPVALIALLLTAQSRRHASWLILTVLCALPIFYIGHYLVMQQIQGWPSDAPLPRQFHMLGFDITEPEPGETGRILMWVKAVDNDQPRAHRLAYDQNLHRQLISAGKRQAEGKTQIGTRSRKPSDGPVDGGQEIINFEDARGRSLPLKQ